MCCARGEEPKQSQVASEGKQAGESGRKRSCKVRKGHVQCQLQEGRVCDVLVFIVLEPCRVTGAQEVFMEQIKK